MWRRIGNVVYAQSLKRDIVVAAVAVTRFTNVDDVTHDHASQRAMRTIVQSVFRSAAFHSATIDHRMFLRRDFRQRADYFASQSTQDWPSPRRAQRTDAA